MQTHTQPVNTRFQHQTNRLKIQLITLRSERRVVIQRNALKIVLRLLKENKAKAKAKRIELKSTFEQIAQALSTCSRRKYTFQN